MVANGFIISPKDVYPIIPEAGYITEPEIEFYYQRDRSLQDDKAILINCLIEQKDTDGLNKLGYSYYFWGNKDIALSVWEKTISEFYNSDKVDLLKHVAIAFNIKAEALEQLDRLKCKNF